MKKLENLKCNTLWTTHVDAIKGCLAYHKLDVTDAWLFGATGHAFILNIAADFCPSGPTAWISNRFMELVANIGSKIEGVNGDKFTSNLTELQKQAWEHCRKSIDAKLPCYAWGLEYPEYYTVHGYDDVGYYFRGIGVADEAGPFSWQKLGDDDIGCVMLLSVKKVKPQPDAIVIKEALDFTLEFAFTPAKYKFDKWETGLKAYDWMIAAFESGKLNGFGLAYNMAVYAECRQHAVEFLKEVKARLNRAELNPLFDQAIEQYTNISADWQQLATMFPCPPIGEECKDPKLLKTAALLSKDAKKWEAQGLETLKEIKNKQ